MTRHIRVKGVRREIVDDEKLALAVWLLAKAAVGKSQKRESYAKSTPNTDKEVPRER